MFDRSIKDTATTMKTVAIIDYGMGNLLSVRRGLEIMEQLHDIGLFYTR